MGIMVPHPPDATPDLSPKHRRCAKPRHHVWQYRRTGICWTLARCVLCGREDLA